MSRTICVSLWFLVSFWTYFAQGGQTASTLDGLIGTDTVVNNAGETTIRNLAKFGNTDQPDLGDVPLAKGRSYEYLVVSGITSVTSWCVTDWSSDRAFNSAPPLLKSCKMTNATGNYDIEVLSWSSDPTRVQAVPCTPDCQWTVDASGFSVTNPANQQLEFVLGWSGPLVK